MPLKNARIIPNHAAVVAPSKMPSRTLWDAPTPCWKFLYIFEPDALNLKTKWSVGLFGSLNMDFLLMEEVLLQHAQHFDLHDTEGHAGTVSIQLIQYFEANSVL